ncbi:cyclin [Cavenderia fasciculata]|uniref:Cyclin n=1 Tax=Cavenderia fasciculata TaxID=261658 RepID=F4Q8V9_CACFS|nr:cyclin [Cavenderia fasciculata]EGG15128.1 cyclin [Cavenderia fasciculata]|eukprot:XP_004351848.1 cyclin [Cavenderia fasciculata]
MVESSNLYFTNEEIIDSPSKRDGIDPLVEDNLRRYGADIIQEAGVLLKLPQISIVTSQAIFHRFYCRKSFKEHDVHLICMGVIFVSCKYTESLRGLRAVVNVFNYIQQKREKKTIEFLDTNQQRYWDLKHEVIEAELTLLKEFGFMMSVEPPHKYILSYMKLLDRSNELAQKAWNFLNDSMRTTLCVQYKPESISAAAIFMAARMLKVKLPEHPYAWWEIFDTTHDEIESISFDIYNLYTKPKPYYIPIDKL